MTYNFTKDLTSFRNNTLECQSYIPKFVCMHVLLHLQNKFNSDYTIYGNAFPHSSSCKDLGINLSDNLEVIHYQTTIYF